MPRRTAEESEATRRGLVAAARPLFAERGYADVNTEEIVAAAGVTRGALYHHFKEKRALFAAVFRAVEEDFVARIGAKALAEPDPFQRLVVGMRATLDAVADEPEVRIAFVDAPAILGYDDWHAIVQETSLGAVRILLEAAMEADALKPLPSEATAHVVLGALNEAGRLVAAGSDRDEAGDVLISLLEGLRP